MFQEWFDIMGEMITSEKYSIWINPYMPFIYYKLLLFGQTVLSYLRDFFEKLLNKQTVFMLLFFWLCPSVHLENKIVMKMCLFSSWNHFTSVGEIGHWHLRPFARWCFSSRSLALVFKWERDMWSHKVTQLCANVLFHLTTVLFWVATLVWERTLWELWGTL